MSGYHLFEITNITSAEVKEIERKRDKFGAPKQSNSHAGNARRSAVRKGSQPAIASRFTYLRERRRILLGFGREFPIAAKD